MIRWHIGCSGFHYKHWKSLFYPEGLAQSKWFSFYAEHFDSLELNATFYRTPTPKSLANWYVISPPGFNFAVKAPRAITHYRKFNDVQDIITRFYDLIQTGLQEKLAATLFQLHPNYAYTEAHLEAMLNNLSPAFTNVVEFRHPSWWNEQVYIAFAERNIVFSGISHPTLPNGLVSNARSLYYRFHGANELYSSEYSTAELLEFVRLVEEKDVSDAYIFFNNDIGGAAVRNAAELKKLVSL
ncbi:uncharacterized protein YecE (DUF72 family) [Arcticibacter pallidicorallinus]|uniref:Uncharacterized protein YecE (DUF72 family) n=1 Tax=Arcticibacter pallidicorallinus TaxID=1259464 RepID=A0A2T0TXB8_9SPHI|nr:DUF72 domain-containing protein [Arcticibacter pallidicorallinus]PRY50317.1 uncharacterized protein YecE (DUF72 family) [Arcticibacter pallidicorallinus]